VLPFLTHRGTRARPVFLRQANRAAQYSRVTNFVLQVALPRTLLAQVKPSVCTQHARRFGYLARDLLALKTPQKKGYTRFVRRRNHVGKYPLINSRRI
jgi:hypothetical protein